MSKYENTTKVNFGENNTMIHIYHLPTQRRQLHYMLQHIEDIIKLYYKSPQYRHYTHSRTLSTSQPLYHPITDSTTPPNKPPTHTQTDSLTHSLTHSTTQPLNHSNTHSLNHSNTQSLKHSLNHLLSHSVTHYTTHSINLLDVSHLSWQRVYSGINNKPNNLIIQGLRSLLGG